MASLSEAISDAIMDWNTVHPGLTVIDIMNAFMEIRVSLLQAEREATNVIVLEAWAKKHGRVRLNL